MKKKYIINKKSEIDSLFKSKNKRGSSYFVLYKNSNPENVNFRFAMSIGKKYGNAVARNKIKRQIRSIIREFKDSIDPKTNFVIVIKPLANQLQFEDIRNNIFELLQKIELMETKNEKNL